MLHLRFRFIIKSIFLLLALLSFSYTNADGSKTISSGYDSYSICQENVTKYNAKFPDFIRSDCFLSSWKYYYYICNKWSSCSTSSSSSKYDNNNSNNSEGALESNENINSNLKNNPYSQYFSSSIIAKLDAVVFNLKQKKKTLSPSKFNSLLNSFVSKLKTIKNKYPNKKKIWYLVGYLNFEIKKLYTNNEVDNFFCDLLWNCDDNNWISDNGWDDDLTDILDNNWNNNWTNNLNNNSDSSSNVNNDNNWNYNWSDSSDNNYNWYQDLDDGWNNYWDDDDWDEDWSNDDLDNDLDYNTWSNDVDNSDLENDDNDISLKSCKSDIDCNAWFRCDFKLHTCLKNDVNNSSSSVCWWSAINEPLTFEDGNFIPNKSGQSLCRSGFFSDSLKFNSNKWILEWTCVNENTNSSGKCAWRVKVDAFCWDLQGREVEFNSLWKESKKSFCSSWVRSNIKKPANGKYYSYLMMNTDDNFSISDITNYYKNAYYRYSCKWLNWWKSVTCDTGKVFMKAKCSTTPLKCKFWSVKITDEESIHDSKVWNDWEYNWQCEWLNSSSVDCKTNNTDRYWICGSYSKKTLSSLDSNHTLINHELWFKILSGDSCDKVPQLSKIKSTVQSLWWNCTPATPTSHLCRVNGKIVYKCEKLSFSPDKLCAIPTGFSWVQGDLVNIIDGNWTDWTFNWECLWISWTWKPLPNKKVSCSTTKLKWWECSATKSFSFPSQSLAKFPNSWFNNPGAYGKLCSVWRPIKINKTSYNKLYWKCVSNGIYKSCSADKVLPWGGSNKWSVNAKCWIYNNIYLTLPSMSKLSSWISKNWKKLCSVWYVKTTDLKWNDWTYNWKCKLGSSTKYCQAKKKGYGWNNNSNSWNNSAKCWIYNNKYLTLPSMSKLSSWISENWKKLCSVWNLKTTDLKWNDWTYNWKCTLGSSTKYCQAKKKGYGWNNNFISSSPKCWVYDDDSSLILPGIGKLSSWISINKKRLCSYWSPKFVDSKWSDWEYNWKCVIGYKVKYCQAKKKKLSWNNISKYTINSITCTKYNKYSKYYKISKMYKDRLKRCPDKAWMDWYLSEQKKFNWSDKLLSDKIYYWQNCSDSRTYCNTISLCKKPWKGWSQWYRYKENTNICEKK